VRGLLLATMHNMVQQPKTAVRQIAKKLVAWQVGYGATSRRLVVDGYLVVEAFPNANGAVRRTFLAYAELCTM
jgi:hypothetical protein